jgi:hypothetical protein
MDQSEKRQAGAEVEITPEMIEAGASTLWGSGTVEVPLDSDRLVVEQIFSSMMCASRRREAP